VRIYIDGSTRAAVNRMFPIWKKLGHSIVSSPKEATVQLSVVKIKNKDLPTLLRLDGVYYDLGVNYTSMNSEIAKSHAKANAIIYQSEFSKKMCERYLLKRSTKKYDVVFNGVDDWHDPKEHSGINIVSCAKWRRPKRLPETIQVFQEFRKEYPNSILHIYGPMSTGSQKIKSENVKYYGRVDEATLKEAYKTADIYLHLCKKDSCPSSVVEAISAKVPVVTTNACGGATEMCILSKGGFVAHGEEVTTNPDYIYKDKYNRISEVTIRTMVSFMIGIIKYKPEVILPKEMSINHTAKKYLSLMEKINR